MKTSEKIEKQLNEAKNTKVVSLPITVPVSNYCWDGKVVCDYYDNEGGGSRCLLGFNPKRDKKD